jgi:hypothetical protein
MDWAGKCPQSYMSTSFSVSNSFVTPECLKKKKINFLHTFRMSPGKMYNYAADENPPKKMRQADKRNMKRAQASVISQAGKTKFFSRFTNSTPSGTIIA